MKNFRSAYSDVVRVQSHPVGESMAEQCFKEDCDVNFIMKRFKATGQVSRFAKDGLHFGDFTNVVSYQEAMQLAIDADNEFMRLPADLRYRFGNDVGKFLEFYDDPVNADECVKLGLKVADVKSEQPSTEPSGSGV